MIRDVLSPETLHVFYTESESYAAGKQTGSSDREMRLIEIPGFPGKGISSSEKLLVVLLGFHGSEATFVREEVQPRRTVAVNGFPAYLLHFKNISILANRGLLSDTGVRRNLRYAPANDPFETYNVLEAICSDHDKDYITLAALGPKPMALGAAMFALNHPRIRVAHPTALDMDNRVSKKCGRTWLYEIPSEMFGQDS